MRKMQLDFIKRKMQLDISDLKLMKNGKQSAPTIGLETLISKLPWVRLPPSGSQGVMMQL